MRKDTLKIGLIAATGGDKRSYGIPLGLGYLASYLYSRADSEFSPEILLAEDLSELIDFKPDVAGISSVTSCFNEATQIAAAVKEACGARVVAGGYHVSALPHKMPVCFDAVVMAEGEETLCELLAATHQSGWEPGVLSRVAGIAYREGEQVIVNEPRAAITPLDSLPHPQRSINPSGPTEATIFTSRGCPYNCVFCASCRHWARYRSFSADYVVGEIEDVLQTLPGIKSFYILDDLFIANRPRLRRMVELLEERGLTSRLSFRGFVRSNLVDEECCELLLRMNCREVRFGAESASPRILAALKLDTTTVEDHQRCIDLCNDSGISIAASYMVGNPGETEEDLRLTYDFIIRNKGKAKVEGFYLLTPLPGTPVWDACLQEGIVSEEMDWSRLNLAFDNPDFCWEDFVYANVAMPRADFAESVRNHGLLLGHDLKLEIGAGESPEPGFLHLDIRSGPHIEYVTDARRLPFPDGAVCEIYSRHNLEHFTFTEAREVLQECLRVLKPGGEIYLIVPNMEFHIEQYYSADQKHAQAGFWGWQRNPFDVHKWGYWWESLHNLLASVGFARIENLTGREDSRHHSLMHLEVRSYKPRPHESLCQPIAGSSKEPFVMRSEHERTEERIRQLEEEIAARDAFIEQLCGRS